MAGSRDRPITTFKPYVFQGALVGIADVSSAWGRSSPLAKVVLIESQFLIHIPFKAGKQSFAWHSFL